MSYSPIAIKRSYVLGNIYKQCEPIESIPVYMNEESGEPLGYADESLGHYADAFTFNLPEAVCKQISASHFDYAFGYDYAKQTDKNGGAKRIKLNHILLVMKKPLFDKKPVTAKEIVLQD